jgi:quercetin dioxygenase-like cupin family protein
MRSGDISLYLTIYSLSVLLYRCRACGIVETKEVIKMDEYPDAFEAAKGAYKILLENDKVRVSEMRLPAGEKMEMHNHPTTIVYVLDDIKNKWTMPDGSTQIIEQKAGEAMYSEPFSHAVENTGENETHLIVIEMKKMA